jgi:hypothetical protein
MSALRIALIASANGLGHARRLLHYAARWRTESQITLVVTTRQRALLQNEIEFVDPFPPLIEVLECEVLGLQGPKFHAELVKTTRPNESVMRVLNDANWVITDNALWPFEYRPDSILFAQFIWIDYYMKSRQDWSSVITSDVFRKDLRLLEVVSRCVSLKDFGMGSVLELPNRTLTPLPKYIGDTDIRFTDNAWIGYSVGTTGLAQKRNLFGLKESFFISQIETFEIMPLGTQPRGIIGRPGLGTIRDCIALGIPFCSIHVDDYELSHNADVVKEIGVLEDGLSYAKYDFYRIDASKLAPIPTFESFCAF